MYSDWFITDSGKRSNGGARSFSAIFWDCLLYTSDAADERSSVDLGGRRIIKKKTAIDIHQCTTTPPHL